MTRWFLVADDVDGHVPGFVDADSPEEAIVTWAGPHADSYAYWAVEAEHVRRFEPEIPAPDPVAASRGGRARSRPQGFPCGKRGAVSAVHAAGGGDNPDTPPEQGGSGGVADIERVMNPQGYRVLTGGPNPVVLAHCRICDGQGCSGAFVCPACNGAGAVLIK